MHIKERLHNNYCSCVLSAAGKSGTAGAGAGDERVAGQLEEKEKVLKKIAIA